MAEPERPSLVLKQLVDEEDDAANWLAIYERAIKSVGNGNLASLTIGRDIAIGVQEAQTLAILKAWQAEAQERFAGITRRIEAAVAAIRSQE